MSSKLFVDLKGMLCPDCLRTLIARYGGKPLRIPKADYFSRNEDLYRDFSSYRANKKGYLWTVNFLSLKYNLSVSSVKRIVKHVDNQVKEAMRDNGSAAPQY